jgi:hypothetical protein
VTARSGNVRSDDGGVCTAISLDRPQRRIITLVPAAEGGRGDDSSTIRLATTPVGDTPGPRGWTALIVGGFAGFLLVAVYGIALLMSGRVPRKHQIHSRLALTFVVRRTTAGVTPQWPRGGSHQAARRWTSQTVVAMSNADDASSQPPSISWKGQNRLAGW